MEFSDSDTNSDKLDEDLESELYSVLHYNTLSEKFPTKLLDKYDIVCNEQNEYLISLKKTVKTEAVEKNILAAENLKDTDFSLETPSLNCKVVVISDDDSDSVIVMEEPISNITYVSSPSVEEISDSRSISDMDDMIINVDNNKDLLRTVDSWEESVEVKWKEAISPQKWTANMRKYYNKPCDKLKNFDLYKVLSDLKGNGDWQISNKDRFPSRKRDLKRCTICRQCDHLRKNCPRRFLNCYMCGNPGHDDSNCPFKKCLNCGSSSPLFVSMCHRCEPERNKKCSECHQKGHSKYLCPDTWRRFHSTTKEEIVAKEVSLNENLVCCNCAEEGHLFENCQNLYWSSYPPTSFLVRKKNGLVFPTPPEPHIRSPLEAPYWSGKRHMKFEEDSFDFNRTPRRPKRNHNRTSIPPKQRSTPSTPFNQRSTPFTPFNPRSTSPTPFNRGSTSSISFNQTSTPFNQASTSYNKFSSYKKSQVKKKMRYFNEFPFINNRKSKHNHSHDGNHLMNSPKKKNRKSKNKN